MSKFAMVAEAVLKCVVLIGMAHIIAHTIVWLWKMGG